MVRVVIDTNVLVSALIGHGKPRRLLRLVLRAHTVVGSREMIVELTDVLARAKFSLTERQVSRFLAIYVRHSQVVDIHRRVEAVKEDPDDNIILEAAINGGAAFIVTGDKLLLALKEFDGVRIITVDAALRMLSTTAG